MDPRITIALLVCALACAGLLLSQRWGSRWGVWVTKPLAAGAFVVVGIAAGGLDSTYGRWVIAGLALSWLGDVLLIPAGVGLTFLTGMASFLLAHVAYSGAFWSLGLSSGALAGGGTITLAAMVLASRWLWPKLRGAFRWAIPVYVVAIGAMVALSFSASLRLDDVRIGLGACLFALSDMSVARDRFVHPAFANSVWGLPLYFLAQMLLALTVFGVSGRPLH